MEGELGYNYLSTGFTGRTTTSQVSGEEEDSDCCGNDCGCHDTSE